MLRGPPLPRFARAARKSRSVGRVARRVGGGTLTHGGGRSGHPDSRNCRNEAIGWTRGYRHRLTATSDGNARLAQPSNKPPHRLRTQTQMGGSASKPEDIVAIAKSAVSYSPPLGDANPVRPPVAMRPASNLC